MQNSRSYEVTGYEIEDGDLIPGRGRFLSIPCWTGSTMGPTYLLIQWAWT